MTRLFTREQARAFLKENKLTDGDSIQKALVKEFGELLQEALETELDHELGYSKYDWKNKETDNSRNGHTKKTVSSKFGKMDISIPRDTKGEFNPAIVKKHERRLNNSVEDMIISMYAKGMSTRDIDKHVGEIYGLDISAELVTRITDKVIPIAKEWQNRPLEEFYPILYLDGMVFNVKQDGQITKKTVYLITAINICGEKDVLGIWIVETESAKFWMSVLTDISNRGVRDILIASIDGLRGFEGAIISVFPKTEIIAPSNPLSPSIDAIRISLTPLLLMSVSTLIQNFADSVSPIQIPKTSFSPHILIAVIRYTVFFVI